jgi:hypothetical protein
LICFGALFPPLALVITLSIVKDVMSIRLCLGRYHSIIEAIKDTANTESHSEDNKENEISLKERMLKLRNSMNEEIGKAGVEIWNGVWYGVILASGIWAFVLFDTLASKVGVYQGLWVLLVMAMCPFAFNRLFLIIQRRLLRTNGLHLDEDSQATHSTTNPINSYNDNRWNQDGLELRKTIHEDDDDYDGVIT